MITFDRVTFTYDGATRPVLRDVSFDIPEGELCLVAGLTGCGKSTLLQAVNGLVPHFTGGTLVGRIVVAGRSTADSPPREFADAVGLVGQDPVAGFVTDTVEEELAYGMEQLALPPAVMRKRVEETLDLLRLAGLRRRALRVLSGGEQQRVAIGAALTAQPRVLVLDEPTSALDPTAAEDVLAAITRLVHDLGVTVLVAEHRLERVAQYADRVLYLPGDGGVVDGPPEFVLADAPVAPPVVQLGRIAGWAPPPVSVRDARRLAGPLRARLAGAEPAGDHVATVGDIVAEVSGLSVMYDDVVAVRELDLSLRSGEVTALMGRNGSGKSSLLWALAGARTRATGSIRVRGGAGWADPGGVRAAAARELVALVPQTPSDLLYRTTLRAELDAGGAKAAAAARDLLHSLAGPLAEDGHPRDLSEGQRLAVVLALQLSTSAPVVLLDEPTRGLDYAAKDRLAVVLTQLATDGRAIVCATHDVEFVAGVADRVVVLAEGDIVADGPTADVVVSSPAFAPQVAKIMAPQPWLTVPQVAAALDALDGAVVP